jgi:hypothetical protein
MIGFIWLGALLSSAVLSHRTSLFIFVMLILTCVQSVGLPSVVMWGDRGEIRCCSLSKVWNDGEGYEVIVKACSLIRYTVGSVTCSDEWEISVVTHLGSHGARGVVVPRTTLKNLSNAMVLRTILVKPSIRLIVNICNDM